MEEPLNDSECLNFQTEIPKKEQSIELNGNAVERLPNKFLRSATKFSGMTKGGRT